MESIDANLSIRRVEAADVATTTALFERFVYPGDHTAAATHLAGHTDGEADTFLAWIRYELAGFVTIRWRSNNPDFRRANVPLIHQLAVFPKYRRQGFGSRLLDAAEGLIATRADRAGITVGLFAEYGPAQRLYAKRGYIPDGRGICQGLRVVRQGEVLTLDHDLILWLTKDLHRIAPT